LQNLIIFGDSWGCGAWSTPTKFNGIGSVIRKRSNRSIFDIDIVSGADDHLSNRFSEHYNVENYSQGADVNRNQTIYLLKFLEKNKSEGFSKDKFLFIQTDPIRDLLILMQIPYRHDAVDIRSLGNICDPDNFFAGILEFTYMQLDYIAKYYDVTINITGGCSDIVSIDPKYDNLNVVCDSFYRLVDKNHTNSIYATTHDYNFKEEDTDRYENIINGQYDKHQIEKIYRSVVDRESYFGYHEDSHPSQTGINLWVDYMLPRIK